MFWKTTVLALVLSVCQLVQALMTLFIQLLFKPVKLGFSVNLHVNCQIFHGGLDSTILSIIIIIFTLSQN